jgi:hypothetical protein
VYRQQQLHWLPARLLYSYQLLLTAVCHAAALLFVLMLLQQRTSIVQGFGQVCKVLGCTEHGVEVPEVLQDQHNGHVSKLS